jgi:sortase A
MSVDQEQSLLLDPGDDDVATDPEHALRRLSVGVGVLERRLARDPGSDATDDDLLMASLALSLERLARDATNSAVDDDQRRRLGDAAARIRTVIDELAKRERRLHAVGGAAVVDAEPVAEPEAAAAAVPVSEPAAPASAADEGRARSGWMRTAGIAMIAAGLLIGVFIVYEFAYTSRIEQRSQNSLLATFRQKLHLGQFDDPSAPVESGPVAVLSIPEIGVHQAVVQGSSPGDLKQGPGHLPGSPLPGEYGNAVILGHRLTYGAPFEHLDQLAKGDHIVVDTGQGRFTYTVSGETIVHPGQNDVIGRSADSRLTLVTSASAFSSDRLAVTATLDGNPVGVATRPLATAGADQLGTSGDIAGLYLALLWTIALVAAVVASSRAYRMWPRTAAYLVTTPVLLMLVVLIYRSLDSFLPGTL